MNFRNLLIIFAIIFLSIMNINAQSESTNVPKDWQTLAEQTDYQRTWNYADTIAFAQKLDKASDQIIYKSFGKSGEGRDMPLLIVSNDKTFSVEKAKKAARR